MNHLQLWSGIENCSHFYEMTHQEMTITMLGMGIVEPCSVSNITYQIELELISLCPTPSPMTCAQNEIAHQVVLASCRFFDTRCIK